MSRGLQAPAAAKAQQGPGGVSLLGASLDVGNRGVVALGVSLAGLFAQTRPDAPIVFHYGNSIGGDRSIHGDRTIRVQVRNCRLSPTSALAQHIGFILLLAALHRVGIRGPARQNPWLRSLIDAEVIGDIRGGDSFSDIYGLRRFVAGSLPLLSVILLGCRYAMLPQTYGPFRGTASRWLAAALLRRATEIWTRDRNCTELIAGLSGRPGRFCPDVAFTLKAMKPTTMAFRPEGFLVEGSGPLVGVNVSGLLYMGGYTGKNMFELRSDYGQMMDRLVNRLLRHDAKVRVLLIPHTFGSEHEEEACAAILESVGSQHPGRVFMLTTPLNASEVKWLIGQTAFFVGSRMHSCIAALSQCVAAVGLGYSDKFRGVFESADVGDSVIDLRVADQEAVIDKVMSAYEHRGEIAKQLEYRIPAVQQQVFGTFQELLRRDGAF